MRNTQIVPSAKFKRYNSRTGSEMVGFFTVEMEMVGFFKFEIKIVGFFTFKMGIVGFFRIQNGMNDERLSATTWAWKKICKSASKKAG